MKKITLILFFSFCATQCLPPQHLMSIEELRHIFGPESPKETYGIVELGFPPSNPKPGNIWTFPAWFSNGLVKRVKMKLTDGVLASNKTEVAFIDVQHTLRPKIFTYEANKENLTLLGKFDFYQDFATKSAIIVYHDLGIIEGFIDDYRLERDVRNPHHQNYLTTTYLLKSIKQSKYIAIPVDGGEKDPPRPGENDEEKNLTTVYPQLLIQLDYDEVKAGWLQAARRMLAYWNVVDMIYSEFEEPRIKFNIAGLLIPKDHNAEPWQVMEKKPSHSSLLNAEVSLANLGSHFNRSLVRFYADEYDIMISYSKPRMLLSHDVTLWASALNASCDDRTKAVAMIQSNMTEFTNTIDALKRLFSNYGPPHSTDISTKENIKAYFSNPSHRCFENCPATKPNCHEPAPKNKKPFCLREPADVCGKDRTTITPVLSCMRGLLCTEGSKGEIDNCLLTGLDPLFQRLCDDQKYMKIPKNYNVIDTDGLACDPLKQRKDGTQRACFQGRCVVIDPNTPACSSLT